MTVTEGAGFADPLKSEGDPLAQLRRLLLGRLASRWGILDGDRTAAWFEIDCGPRASTLTTFGET